LGGQHCALARAWRLRIKSGKPALSVAWDDPPDLSMTIDHGSPQSRAVHNLAHCTISLIRSVLTSIGRCVGVRVRTVLGFPRRATTGSRDFA
jgi:hypothetical protein